MEFKLINSNRFCLANTKNRFLHLGTVQYNLREFMCFADRKTAKIYIEEITGGSLEFIKDDKLAEALHQFCIDKKVLDMTKPLLPDTEWYKKPGVR